MCMQHKEFAHLTQEHRFRIEALWEEGINYHGIAIILLVDDSVVSREFKRNKEKDGSYCALKAQKKAEYGEPSVIFSLNVI